MTMAREVWQAYDCPLSGIDFDLDDDALVFRGVAIRCSGCRQTHRAGQDVSIETCVELGDGEREFHDLPESAEALAALVKGTE